jgi:ArsR family transcriptional regulator
MTLPRLAIHDRLSELADATRSRLLLALEGQSLTVGELCAVLQLPQSTVSRHLRILSDDGWVVSRADGASRWYRLSPALDGEAEALWRLVRGSLADAPWAAEDRARIAAVVQARPLRSAGFFAESAGEWDALRATLFGARADLLAALGLLDPSWQVGDLGCGTGTLSAALAPHVARVEAVDASPAMLAAARQRLEGLPNVALHEGTLEALPLADGSLDAAVLLLVLHHVADPLVVLREVRRVLRPGGRVLVADMRAHTREHYRQEMGHRWLGFEPRVVTGWLDATGFTAARWVPLPVDPAATGPALFTATGRAG